MKRSIFGLFALIVFSSAVHSQTEGAWSGLVSVEYNFKIAFPGAANEEAVDSNGKKVFRLAITTTNLPPKPKRDKLSQLFIITVQNVSEHAGLTESQILDKYDHWKTLNMTLWPTIELKKEEITVEGYTARQYVYRDPDSTGEYYYNFSVHRILLARGRIYFFGGSVSGATVSETDLIFNERIRKFMDSFHLLS